MRNPVVIKNRRKCAYDSQRWPWTRPKRGAAVWPAPAKAVIVVFGSALHIHRPDWWKRSMMNSIHATQMCLWSAPSLDWGISQSSYLGPLRYIIYISVWNLISSFLGLGRWSRSCLERGSPVTNIIVEGRLRTRRKVSTTNMYFKVLL